jgi:hypothetical protein
MPDRIANLIVLAEDKEQRNLVHRYVERCGHDTRTIRFVPLPARAWGGSGEKYVRDRYPAEVQACRSSLGKRASAFLVAIIDADRETTGRRASQLSEALKAAGMEDRHADEPIVVLIPKRHVETWIRALLGKTADEVTDYTKSPHQRPTSAELKNAASKLYKWTRPGAAPPSTSPPSLTASIPEWRKIPKLS